MSDTTTGSGSGSGSRSGRDPVERILESFLARWRRGQRPNPEEYAGRCPERAEEIRELLLAMIELEQLKPDVEAAPAPAGRPTARPAPPHPERLGDYRILRVVGEGGMGVVYEAEHESLKNRVALKVMHPRFRADGTSLRRFRVEARAAARLHHTNIVPVFDFGEHDGICYYAMQYIDGVGLNDVLDDVRRLRAEAEAAGGPGGADSDFDQPTEAADVASTVARGLRTGRFPPAPTVTAGPGSTTGSLDAGATQQVGFVVEAGPPDPAPAPPPAPSGGSGSSMAGQPEATYFREVARLGAQVADALDYAHRQGVVHRDIKPSNLLLDAQGNTWVTDFGLAKLVEGDDLSQSHDLVGTLRFMAPERFRGVTDRRSDIYALGATLYELLALRPTFNDTDHARLIDQIVHQPPAPLRQHDRRIPRDLETIVLRALSKDPADRCERAGEMRDELRRFLEGRPTRWRRVGPVEQFRRWCKRNPLIAGLNALAATLTIAIAVISTVAAFQNGRLAARANANLVEARKNLIQAYITEAEARRVSRRVGQRFEALDAIRRAMRLAPKVGITEAQRSRLRDEAIAAMALPDLRVARELGVPRAKDNGFAIDPAFERYAFRRDDGTVIVRRLADDAELIRLVGPPPVLDHSEASFSPDGRYLAMSTGADMLQVWDLRDGRLVLTDRERAFGIPFENWSFRPDGPELALGRLDGSIVFYELPSGRLIRRWTEHPVHTGMLAYSPDGSKLAVQDRDLTRVKILDRDSGHLLASLAHPSNADHFAWNPRRPNVLAVACNGGEIAVWDTSTGEPTGLFQGEGYGGQVIAYHPGGELVAVRGWQRVLRVWDVRTGRQVLARPSNWMPSLRFDPAGRRLGADVIQEKARLLEFADGSECRTVVVEPFREGDRHHALAIDPTGHWAVTLGTAATVWDLPTGAALATLPIRADAHRVRFDASGAILTSLPSLLRWPLSDDPGAAATIGPPQLLHPRGTQDLFDVAADGRTIAAAMYDGGSLVLDVQDPGRATWLRPQHDVRNIAISPDGRWVVSGSHSLPGEVKVWDARTGRPVRDLSDLERYGLVPHAFSPDGRWLAVIWDGWVLFETTTWRPALRLSRGPTTGLAFAPDSRTVAFDDNAGHLILADTWTGREVAGLEDPELVRTSQVQFTPDGSQLVSTLVDRPYFRVWDLRAIRRRLADLGLDWNPPAKFDTPDRSDPFPPSPAPFRVDRGQLDSLLATTHQQRLEALLADSEASWRQNPEQADVRSDLAQICNNLAWLLATGPEGFRDPARALALARRAVELTPDESMYLNTLGVALYRDGRLVEAVPVLERSLAASHGNADAFDLFFLAMARHRLGQPDRARADFDRAVAWRRDHPNQPDPQSAAELDPFQAEARAVLDGPPAELPANVFAPEPPDPP